MATGLKPAYGGPDLGDHDLGCARWIPRVLSSTVIAVGR